MIVNSFIWAFLCSLVVVIHARPEQIRLHMTDKPDEVMVTWITRSKTTTSTVKYGFSLDKMDMVATNNGNEFTHEDGSYESDYIHRVILTNLQPGSYYRYICGDEEDGWSTTWEFHSEPANGPDTTSIIGTFGDQSYYDEADVVLAGLNSHNYPLSLFIIVGDLAYADDEMEKWDDYGRFFEPFTARVPVMHSLGNHDNDDGGDAYQARCPAPGQGYEPNVGRDYYSHQHHNLHIIAIDSESDLDTGDTQYKWIEQDLIKANLPENRAKWPFIIVHAHKPLYSGGGHGDQGRMEDLEALLDKYDVDLGIFGHDHHYERFYPAKDGKATTSHKGHPLKEHYVASDDTVHTVVGTGGRDPRDVDARSGFTVHSEESVGYALIYTHGYDYLWFQYHALSGDNKGEVADEFIICRNPNGCDLSDAKLTAGKDGGYLATPLSHPGVSAEEAAISLLKIQPNAMWTWISEPQVNEDWKTTLSLVNEWNDNNGPFGYGDEHYGANYGHQLPFGKNVFFRKVVDFTNDEWSKLAGGAVAGNVYVSADDSATMWINGVEIFNEKGVDHEALLADWNTKASIPGGILKQTGNVIAVELYNAAGSSDAYFASRIIFHQCQEGDVCAKDNAPTDPPATQAPSTQPPATQAPDTQPPATQAPSTQPPANDCSAAPNCANLNREACIEGSNTCGNCLFGFAAIQSSLSSPCCPKSCSAEFKTVKLVADDKCECGECFSGYKMKNNKCIEDRSPTDNPITKKPNPGNNPNDNQIGESGDTLNAGVKPEDQNTGAASATEYNSSTLVVAAFVFCIVVFVIAGTVYRVISKKTSATTALTDVETAYGVQPIGVGNRRNSFSRQVRRLSRSMAGEEGVGIINP